MFNKLYGAESNMRRGYTLLFAVITASLVLGVGVFILGVSKKQFALSVSARESMYALYAADSGIECAAREYNYNIVPGGGLSLKESDDTTYNTPSIECNGETYTASSLFIDVGNPDTRIWDTSTEPVYQAGPIIVPFDDVDTGIVSCAVITVAYGMNTNLNKVISITSRGYNQCDSLGPIQSSRTVERALRLTTTN